MIVGKGLIASTVGEIDHQELTVFASGVSNSNELNRSNFQREKDLLLKQDRAKKLLYFSTCSVADPTLAETAYVIHKLEMENLIEEEFPDYLILRLPTLVGRTANPFTFFNHIKNCIINNEEVIVYENAWRYLLDADDLKIIVPFLVKLHALKNSIIHVAFNNSTPVIDLVNLMTQILNKKSRIRLLEKGSHFIIPNYEFMKYLEEYNIDLYTEAYTKDLVKKYLSQ